MEPQRCIILFAKSCRCSLILIDNNQTLAFFKDLFLIYVHQTVDRNYIWSLLTARSTVLREKLTGFQPVKKFPAFYGTRSFITTFTSACKLSLSWASSIQSKYPHPTSWSSFLILPYHLRLGLQVVSFHQVSPPKPCIRLTPPHTRYVPHPSHYSRFYQSKNIGSAVQNVKLLIIYFSTIPPPFNEQSVQLQFFLHCLTRYWCHR